MKVSAELELQSFVLLRLGERRFAVAANQIAELVAPSRVFRFPHKTPKIEGVILRRGRIVPVCDVAEALVGKKLTTRRLDRCTPLWRAEGVGSAAGHRRMRID
jgi:chemotaxis signal transduction protein